MIEKTFSHYKIIKKLGEGGMGVVYKAQDLQLKREVALKFLPDSVSSNLEERQRFENEAQSAASLNHPNISTIYSIKHSDDKIFIVMEYIDGVELKDRIKNGPLSINEITNISIQIGKGLEAAHKKGIVHLDIKSSNIMITDNGQVKIMDFGLAKHKDVQVTNKNQAIGTLAYISPEQLQGLNFGFKSDIWSFGIVLYEMLTSHLPFQGDYDATIIYSILNEEPKAIQSYRSDVPENIISLVSLMLQKDPSNRISSINEIIDLLYIKNPVPESEIEDRSVAVLYFENLSPDKENEYFCAGITEDLIIDLSKIKELKIIPRSDVLPFRNKEINSRKIGEILNVPFILEGSVRKAGQKIRITAQLVDVKSGFPIWVERYDRLIEDIFEIQMEVSQKITEALKLSLTESEKESLNIKPTEDMRAYDFYLRGREFLSKNGKRNMEASIQMFEYALSIDPNFTLANIGLAEACTFEYIYFDESRKWLDKIINASEKAHKKDPDLIESQFGIGLVYFHQKRYAEAINIFKKIIQTKSDFYPAYRWIGLIYDMLEDYDSAIKYHKMSYVLKPYSEEPLMFLQMSYRRKGNIEEAIKVEKEFINVCEEKLKINPDDVIVLSRLASTYAGGNDLEKEKALLYSKRALELDPEDGLAIYNIACVYARLNMREEALRTLKAAFKTGYRSVKEWIKNDPDFNSLRDDLEFRTLVEMSSL